MVLIISQEDNIERMCIEKKTINDSDLLSSSVTSYTLCL